MTQTPAISGTLDTDGSHELIIPSLGQLARRALPQAIEAAIIPAAILLLVTNIASTTVAIGAALAWAVGAIAWRWATRRRVSGMTILSATRLLARSVVAVAAGSTFLYFLQPTIGGIFLAAAFLVSVVINRPLARRFAGDFCNLPRRVPERRPRAPVLPTDLPDVGRGRSRQCRGGLLAAHDAVHQRLRDRFHRALDRSDGGGSRGIGGVVPPHRRPCPLTR